MKRLLTTALLILSGSAFCQAQINLDKEFHTPPESVQTSVYWYWMCGHISKEGVIKDLQEMKRVGINRVFIGNNYFDPYEGGRNVRLMSDEWWEITHTAFKTAAELGIEVGMFNSPGWTQAGGPWIKPEESMRYLTYSETQVKGPAKITTMLEKPIEEFQDVKVVAFPVPKDDRLILNNTNATITVSPQLEGAEKMFDGNRIDGIPLPQDMEVIVDIKANADFTARSLTIYPTHSNINSTFELQAKVDNEYKTLSRFTINWYHLWIGVGFDPFAPAVHTLDETTAREFRLIMKNTRHEGGIAAIELSSSPKLEDFAGKTFAKMCQDPMPQWDYYMWRKQPEVDPGLYLNPDKMLDITEYMSADGKLEWNAPAGEWMVLRMGMTPTKVTNFPAGPDGTGLEVDKINRKHVATHFDAYIGKILERIPPEDRTTFKVVVQDSYESAGLNFTQGFLEDFEARYGYDALPFLATYLGKVVGSQDQSDRFLWDMRRFVADRVAYEYVGGFREISNKHGLRTWLENYGHWGFPTEFLMYGGQSDEIGGEYWTPNDYPSWENDLGNIENRAATSCGHIYGKTLISSESNTSGAPAFARIPAHSKQRTDKYFAEGINNTLLHVYIQQADTNRYPGTNAWFGTEYNRSNTWFSHIDLFIQYVKRCNYMLRQGLNIADVAYFIGEDTPKMTGIQDPALPIGYEFDYINAEVLLQNAYVQNGLLTLPHGTTYRVLVLPRIDTMRPEVLKKITQLVNDGLVVLGPPPTHSPSLENQPEADASVRRMAAALWKNVDGIQVTSATVGKGRIFNGVGLEEVFAAIDCIPDCGIPSAIPFHFGHRRMEIGTDIYFISNQDESKQTATLTFRVSGKQPELWNPMTGTIRPLTEYRENTRTTEVPLTLDKFESAFIVFREAGSPVPGAKNFPEPVLLQEITGTWQVEFNGKLTNPASIQLDQLINLSTHSQDDVKYFSGNVLYSNTFNLKTLPGKEQEIWLDLGEVNFLAKVWVNDQYVSGVWTDPYSVNITSALKKGKNTIRIDVVNTWVNRLIGDAGLPKEERETWVGMSPYKPDSPLPASGLVGPVQLYRIDR